MAKKTFAVIGLGQFGLSILQELVDLHADIIAVDKNEDAVKKAGDILNTSFIADATSEKALIELGIHHATHAIVAYGGDNLQDAIITVVALSNLKIPHIIVRVDDEYYAPVMKKIGATEVITPQKMAGQSLANRLINESFLDYYALDRKFSVIKITVSENFKSKTILELDPRNRYHVNIILITKKGVTSVPLAKDLIEATDTVYLVGDKQKVAAFLEKLE